MCDVNIYKSIGIFKATRVIYHNWNHSLKFDSFVAFQLIHRIQKSTRFHSSNIHRLLKFLDSLCNTSNNRLAKSRVYGDHSSLLCVGVSTQLVPFILFTWIIHCFTENHWMSDAKDRNILPTSLHALLLIISPPSLLMLWVW